MTDIVERLRGLRFVHVPVASGLMEEAAAEIEQLRDAIRRLAEQDATLSVCGGNVTVTMDATLATHATPSEGSVRNRCALTDEEQEAVAYAVSELDHWTHGSEVIEIANTLRKLLERLGGDR